MPVKTFFEDGQDLVLKSLEGLCASNPELIFNRTTKSAVDQPMPCNRACS